MRATHPEMADRWEKETPDEPLPEHVERKRNRKRRRSHLIGKIGRVG
jgi:hypothetical protein